MSCCSRLKCICRTRSCTVTDTCTPELCCRAIIDWIVSLRCTMWFSKVDHFFEQMHPWCIPPTMPVNRYGRRMSPTMPVNRYSRRISVFYTDMAGDCQSDSTDSEVQMKELREHLEEVLQMPCSSRQTQLWRQRQLWQTPAVWRSISTFVTGEEINVIELVSQSWLFGINNGMKGRPSVFTMM
jgi:hypothetical protein